MEKMSGDDGNTFNFSVRQIEWESYMENYVTGVRKYLLKDNQNTLIAYLQGETWKGRISQSTCSHFTCALKSWNVSTRLTRDGLLVQNEGIYELWTLGRLVIISLKLNFLYYVSTNLFIIVVQLWNHYQSYFYANRHTSQKSHVRQMITNVRRLNTLVSGSRS